MSQVKQLKKYILNRTKKNIQQVQVQYTYVQHVKKYATSKKVQQLKNNATSEK